MLRSLRLLLVGLLVATAAAACSFPPAEPGGPSLVSLDDWVSGRNKIWDIAFPQGWLPPVYTENDSGVIFARWSNTEKGRPMGAVTQFDGAFDPSGEGGLMGIALSPGFNAGTDRRVFVCYSTTTDNRVARFDLDLLGPAYTAISNWTPIITGLPHNSFHDGCRVRFQPGTGALFVSTGDAGTATAPQSTTVLGGKILRVDMNGAPWPGNVSGSRWYTRGHRNPQGLAFRPGSNDPYSAEHGPDVNDEVNQLVNGANSGWNPNDGVGNYDQSKPMTDAALEPGNTMTPVWQSGGITVAPSGATFLSGPQWKTWDGALVVACLDGSPSVGQRLLVMHLNGAGTALTGPEVTALDRGVRLRSAVQGPDGNLYVVTDGNNGAGAIWKVVPS
jgi:glucose/arabinose dehydrogenase